MKKGPADRKLEMYGQLKKKMKMIKFLLEKTFEDMREDYTTHRHDKFDNYKKAFKTIIYLTDNLFQDKKKESEESAENKKEEE